jgi:threonine/homoserine/homoserine lactone efflux protein
VAQLAAFLGVSAIVIMTPGQDTALTIRNALVGGRRGGLFTALGVSTGQAVWALAASAGIAALLRASEPAFVAVKLAGAAYLVLLGAQTLRSALSRSDEPSVAVKGRGSANGLRARVAFRQGLISNLGNPKMAVFFTSLLPQVAQEGQGAFATLLGLGLVFCCLTLAWLSVYAVAVAKAGDVLRRSAVRRTLDGITGAVLVGLGLRLASEHR